MTMLVLAACGAVPGGQRDDIPKDVDGLTSEYVDAETEADQMTEEGRTDIGVDEKDAKYVLASERISGIFSQYRNIYDYDDQGCCVGLDLAGTKVYYEHSPEGTISSATINMMGVTLGTLTYSYNDGAYTGCSGTLSFPGLGIKTVDYYFETDNEGNILKVFEQQNGIRENIVSCSYDEAGNLTGLAYSGRNGIETLSFDGDGRLLTKILSEENGGVVNRWEYQYSCYGHPTYEASYLGNDEEPYEERVVVYEYDEDGRMISFDMTEDGVISHGVISEVDGYTSVSIIPDSGKADPVDIELYYDENGCLSQYIKYIDKKEVVKKDYTYMEVDWDGSYSQNEFLEPQWMLWAVDGSGISSMVSIRTIW